MVDPKLGHIAVGACVQFYTAVIGHYEAELAQAAKLLELQAAQLAKVSKEVVQLTHELEQERARYDRARDG